MYNIVICGATDAQNVADGALFADFMGISMTLRDVDPENIKLRARSCFPLDEYFQTWPDVKWGEFGEQREPLYQYTQTQWSTRSIKWFEQVPKEDILAQVLQDVVDAASMATPGDAVNVFILAHGSRKGHIALGTGRLATGQLMELIRTFQSGVQVNLVGTHCYSGRLVNAMKAENAFDRYVVAAAGPTEIARVGQRSVSNRCRNSRFSQPYVQSLAKVKLPYLEQHEGRPISVEEHDRFLKDTLGRVIRVTNPKTGKAEDTKQEYMSYVRISPEKGAAMILLEDLIFRDHTDVLFEVSDMHRRRRVEWPLQDAPGMSHILQQPLDPKTAAMQLAKDAVDMAFAECIGEGLPGEDTIWEELIHKRGPPDYVLLFKNLYFRARQQSAIWDLYLVLVERQFLSHECLGPPINWFGGGEASSTVASILGEFSEILEGDTGRKVAFPGCEWTPCPSDWLSIMIARGCSKCPDRMIELIDYIGVLGDFDYQGYEKLRGWHGGPLTWTCNMQEATFSTQNLEGEFFGSWLPHGLGDDPGKYPAQIARGIGKFIRIERIYKALFQVGDKELVLEEEQDIYFRQHPNLQPRYRYSGSWK